MYHDPPGNGGKVEIGFSSLKTSKLRISSDPTAYTLLENPYNQYQVGLGFAPQGGIVRAEGTPRMSVTGTIEECLQQPSRVLPGSIPLPTHRITSLRPAETGHFSTPWLHLPLPLTIVHRTTGRCLSQAELVRGTVPGI